MIILIILMYYWFGKVQSQQTLLPPFFIVIIKSLRGLPEFLLTYSIFDCWWPALYLGWKKRFLLYLNSFLGWGWNSLAWWNWVTILWIGKSVGCRYPRVSSSIFIKIMIIIVIIDHLLSHLNWMGCSVEQIKYTNL